MSYGGGAGYLHHATPNELSPPLIGLEDASSSVSKIEFFCNVELVQFLNIKCCFGNNSRNVLYCLDVVASAPLIFILILLHSYLKR